MMEGIFLVSRNMLVIARRKSLGKPSLGVAVRGHHSYTKPYIGPQDEAQSMTRSHEVSNESA